MMIDGMNSLDVHWRMMSCMRQLRERCENMLQPFCSANGITPLQLSVLVNLYHTGPQTVSSLARHNCMAGANNSALCKKLAGAGLLERNRDPRDERQVLVSLAPRGKALVLAFCHQQDLAFQALQVQLEPGDIAHFLQDMEQFIQVLEQALPAQELAGGKLPPGAAAAEVGGQEPLSRLAAEGA